MTIDCSRTGLCIVCLAPLALHFDARNRKIPCEQVARVQTGSPEPDPGGASQLLPQLLEAA